MRRGAVERVEATLSRLMPHERQFVSARCSVTVADLREVVRLARRAEELERLNPVCAKCDRSLSPPAKAKRPDKITGDEQLYRPGPLRLPKRGRGTRAGR